MSTRKNIKNKISLLPRAPICYMEPRFLELFVEHISIGELRLLLDSLKAMSKEDSVMLEKSIIVQREINKHQPEQLPKQTKLGGIIDALSQNSNIFEGKANLN